MQMTTGTYISGIGHVGLIGWLLLGWGLAAHPIPMVITEVSVVSGEEYAALVAATTPDPNVEQPAAPVMPEVESAPPAPQSAPEETAPSPPPPQQSEAPDEDLPPPPPPEPVLPPAEVADTAPAMQLQPLDSAPPSDLPVSSRPQPRPVERVAPEAVAPPPPDVAVADSVRETATPDAPAETVVQEAVPEPPAAPQEAATELALETLTPSRALNTSPRPQSRPSRPTPPAPQPEEPTRTAAAPEPTPEPTPAPTPAPTSDIDDAVAAALAGTASSSASSANVQGPPLTGSEEDAFRVSVQNCWRVDPGSDAAQVTVTVGFNLNRSGRVEGDAIRQISGIGGSEAGVRAAYEAARRAILRCQGDGFPLPADKYDQWREVEMEFNPSGMRMR